MSTEVMLILVAITEGLLHYGLRRDVLGKDLPRPVAYTLGTLAMMVPFTFWLIERRQTEVAWVLWLVLVAGGLSVTFWYGVDWVRGMRASLKEARAQVNELEKSIDEALDVKK